MTLDEIHNEVGLLKKAFPGLNDDAVDWALRQIAYMEMFPEDMVEERTSWDELYGVVRSLQSGFDTLYDVVRRMAGEKPETKTAIQEKDTLKDKNTPENTSETTKN